MLSLHGVRGTGTLDTEYLGLGNGMEDEVRAACRAMTDSHRDDFTVSWQTMLARGIAVVGPSTRTELDVQIVQKADGCADRCGDRGRRCDGPGRRPGRT